MTNFEIGKLVDIDKITMAYAAAIDHLDTHEFSEGSIGVALTLVLLEAGYSEVDSYAAAYLNYQFFADLLGGMYWSEPTYKRKMTVLQTMVNIAMQTIENKKIDDETREQIASSLSRAKRFSTDKA